MRLLSRAREPSDDDSFTPKPPRGLRRSRLRLLAKLELPCYVCEGRGRLWMTDELRPRGRFVRCIACKGKGKMRA